MDRQLLERMVGAAVLIVALVVIAPAVLDGPGDQEALLPPAAVPDEDVRTVTIRPDQSATEPPVAKPTASPAAESRPPPVAAARDRQGTATGARPAPAPEPQPAPAATPDAEPGPLPEAEPESSPEPVRAVRQARTGWAVQLGSFADRANAQRLAGEVSSKGYDTYLLPLEKGGRTLYRVRVGPRPTRKAAEQLAGELAAAGYKGQVAAEGQAT